ncbi:hypothetical protein [Clostridium tagluense]|uniref:hypothetical protein n=2 Tax=Clostridium tagluense TaxID=360422 RepID=UPI0027144B76|nr:hypothetical protein [Clostridium tagluense]WLC67160.1 hypothetical protein KTC93_08270 [Clostridium tagluense]
MIDIREHGVGGSGLTPTDSTLMTYTVASGETIKAGNLVNFTGNQVKKCYLKKIKAEIPYNFYNGVYSNSVSCRIDETRVFVAYVVSSTLKMFVMTLENDFISQGNEVTHASSWSSTNLKVLQISDTKVLVVKLRTCFIATINNTDITQGTDFQVGDMTGGFDIVKLKDKQAMLVYQAGDVDIHGNALIINISDSDIITTIVGARVVDTRMSSIKCQKISDTLYLCTSFAGSTYGGHQCFIININNGVITERSIYPSNNSQVPVSVGAFYIEGYDNIIPLSDNTALLVFTDSNKKLNQVLITITGTTVTSFLKGDMLVNAPLSPSIFKSSDGGIIGVGIDTLIPTNSYIYSFDITQGILALKEEIPGNSAISSTKGFFLEDNIIMENFTASAKSFIKIIRATPFAQGMAKNNGTTGQSIKVYKFR